MMQDDGESPKSRLGETQVSQFMRASLKFNGRRSLARIMRGRSPSRLIGSLKCMKEILPVKKASA